jgi:kynurenine formamidase
MAPGIEYHAHADTAGQITGFFPGLQREQLPGGEGWAIETVHLSTHNGTHVDAPYHYHSTMDGGRPAAKIDELPLDWFFGPGVVLDMTAKEDGEAVDTGDVEQELGRIGHELALGDIVLVRTGRDAFIEAPEYLALGPGVTAGATRWLHERGVRVRGIDAWGWDGPLHVQAQQAIEADEPGIFWAAHQADLPYSQIERLVGLGELPATGFQVACFPLRIVGAGGAPARVVAILPD